MRRTMYLAMCVDSLYHLVKIKDTSFGRAIFRYSAIQFSHPLTLTLTSPGQWATFAKVTFMFSTGSYFTLGACAAYIRGPGISNLHRHRPLGYQITPWSSGASEIHFSRPDNFVLSQGRIRTGTSRSAIERATTGPARPDNLT